MLGNIKPYMPALSEDSKKIYSAYYCGLCKNIGKSYGIFSRFMLTYDMAFVAIIYDSLHKDKMTVRNENCFANPFKRKPVLHFSDGTQFAADVLVMLAYHKIKDNIHDESFFNKTLYRAVLPYVYIKYRRAANKNQNLALILKKESQNQIALEKNTADIDSLCMPTAIMTKNILSYCKSDIKSDIALEQFGFFLGRVIYLLDALKDMPEDNSKGRFNVFNLNNISTETAKEECFIALGEMAYWYKQLDFLSYQDIIDNVIYLNLAREIKFTNSN